MNRKLINSIGAVALSLSLATGVSACSKSDAISYKNEQKSESLNIQERAEGTIPIKFKVPPTLESRAAAKIDGVSKLIDFGNAGVLVSNNEFTQIYRVNNGSVVWSSEKVATPFVTASLVQEGDRSWIVTTRKTGADLEVAVYDAYAHSANQVALRKKTFKNGQALVQQHGVMIADQTGIYKYSARNGLVSKVNLAPGSTLLAATSDGYLVSQNNQVGVASTDPESGWNSMSNVPSGFTPKATNKVIAYSPSVVVLKWTEGNKSTVTFLNNTTGEVLGETDQPLDGDINTPVLSSDNQPIVMVKNISLNLNNKSVHTFDSDIVGIVDGIAYLADGSGRDVTNEKETWKSNLNGEAPVLIYQRQAFYFKEGSLYLINVKYTPMNGSSSSDQKK